MLPYIAPFLNELWGPFRLLGSFLVLIGLGAGLAAFLTAWLTPGLARMLPDDQGRVYTPSPETARGKPTGAGIILAAIGVVVLAFVLPFSWRLWGIVGCLVLAMLTGFLDDRSAAPWGEWKKGVLDLFVAVITSYILCDGQSYTVWLPIVKGSFEMSPWIFIPVVSALLWISINTTNCTDGVDGLAGALTLLTLFYLGGFLYVVIGNTNIADYLLLPHNPDGARWAVVIFTMCGALGGYLWHNAEPSSVLMGDAGSRFLGLLVGVSVIAAGNPFLLVVVAPVVLVNGGTGMLKVLLLRGLRRLGVDISPDAAGGVSASSFLGKSVYTNGTRVMVRALHRVRFPLHDHCRKKLGWSNAQVLMRFMLVQVFLVPILLGILIKIR